MREEPRVDSPDADDLLMNLVEGALALPPGEREQYLRTACAGDTETFNTAWKYVQQEQRMRGFLLEPLIPRARRGPGLKAGDLLEGRFRILREVAQGGMGVVYEALDVKLERRIAIKCAKPGFGKRLPPEVRNASEISHPNVCKIFEIHTAAMDGEEFDFVTMEFLEGETLWERMRRGVLPDSDAKVIARQLAEGLAEAHRDQVVHGDLKSANVILATAPGGAARAVITDFGLASRAAAGNEAGRRQIGGTPDYMAPELLQGGSPSTASDVYALGVILYGLATGRKPFEREASLEERLTRRPPAVKHRWNAVLQKCLDADPARRYRDGGELAKALAPPAGRRRLLAAVAVLIAAVSYMVATQRASTPKESVRLAVLPFEGSGETRPIAEALTRDTAAQVTRLRGNSAIKLTVIPLADSKARLAATHTLRGSVRLEKGNTVVQAYLTDMRSRANAKEWKAEFGPGEMRFAPVAITGIVTGALRLPPASVPATVNAAGHPDYVAGLAAVRWDGKVDQALEHLQRAVAADPDSPLTHAALAEAQWFKYHLTRDPAWRDRVEESVRQAQRRNPDLAAVHRIAGLLEHGAGRYEAAAAVFRRAIELEPGNSDGHRRLGMSRERNNEYDEALAAYRRAAEVEPGYHRNHQALGDLWNKRGDYKEAARHLEKAVELAPEDPSPHFALATSYSYSGRFVEAENQLRLSIRLNETPTAHHALGVVLMYQAKDREAIPCFLRALNWPQRSLWWINLGIAYRRVNRPDLSVQANRKGLALAEKEMAGDPRRGRIRADLAYLCARLGDGRRAQSEVAQALQLAPQNADTLWRAALTYEALGRREDTLGILRSAPGEVLADLSRWPDVADLRQDSRFLELLGSRDGR